jgi:hypothetical protein
MSRIAVRALESIDSTCLRYMSLVTTLCVVMLCGRSASLFDVASVKTK